MDYTINHEDFMDDFKSIVQCDENDEPTNNANYPTKYTLALLDRRLVCDYTNYDETCDYPFVMPFIRKSVHDKVNIEKIKNNKTGKDFYIVQMETYQSTTKGENLTRTISNTKRDDHRKILVFGGALIIFPIEGKPDEAWSYLIGNWFKLLLNLTAVEPLVGLRIVASIGVCAEEKVKDEALKNLKAITIDQKQGRKQLESSHNSVRGFGSMKDFEAPKVASAELNVVRLKPNSAWGNNALIRGNDYLKFTLNTVNLKGSHEKDGIIQCLAKQVETIHKIYFYDNIHIDFRPFLDEMEKDSKIIHKLNAKVNGNWNVLFKKQIHEHQVLWNLTMDCDKESLGEIKRQIKNGPLFGHVKIRRDWVPISSLVKCDPIPIGNSTNPNEGEFYRMDRGRWYHVSESRFEEIRKQIRSLIMPGSVIFLSHCLADNLTKPEKERTEREDAYNERAVQEINEKHSKDLVCLNLDKKCVMIGKGTSQDRFEFADILIKYKKSGEYLLVHVKKEQAKDLDHLRGQVEMCSSYLGDVLDRSPLVKVFLKSIFDEFYSEFIPLPLKKVEQNAKNKKTKKEKTENDKPKLIPRAHYFKDKFEKEKKERTDDVPTPAKKRRVAVGKTPKIDVRVSDQWKSTENGEAFKNFDVSFGMYLDCLTDFFKYTTVPKDDQVNEMSSLRENILERLNLHRVLTSDENIGLLSEKNRDKITIVMAIITEKPFDQWLDNFPRQKLMVIEGAMRTVHKYGFKFKLALILKPKA